MDELQYTQLQLDALVKTAASNFAQKALQDANFAKNQAQVAARIAALETKVAELQAAG